MSLNKTMLLTPVAGFFLLAGIAQAATSAQVNITGQIAAATCDLAVTQSNIDLGSVISGDVTTTGAISSTGRNFTLNLTGCTADQATKEPGTVVSLTARGTAMAANSNYFNSVDGATVGVQLTAVGLPVKPNKSTGLTELKGLTAGGSAQVAMNAQLYSTVLTPASQRIEAPITFSIAYN
ncbi:type 1 fimbrial protein [Serratia fonticola]|nr:type 1 fimbrial protein [Serratia fonticola]NYA46061.1 type 1 fimbrial protein [Serratia fonticola]